MAEAPRRAAAQFAPRLFTAGQSEDIDQRLTPVGQPAELAAAPVLADAAEQPVKLVSAITESLQAAKERPPRAIWLPVLGDPDSGR